MMSDENPLISLTVCVRNGVDWLMDVLNLSNHKPIGLSKFLQSMMAHPTAQQKNYSLGMMNMLKTLFEFILKKQKASRQGDNGPLKIPMGHGLQSLTSMFGLNKTGFQTSLR